jgi:hypothetical protein
VLPGDILVFLASVVYLQSGDNEGAHHVRCACLVRSVWKGIAYAQAGEQPTDVDGKRTFPQYFTDPKESSQSGKVDKVVAHSN